MERKEVIDRALEVAIERYLAAHNTTIDKRMVPKIGKFILALAATEPTIPFAGKRLRDLSVKQRILFQSEGYEGTMAGEFLGHRTFAPEFYFLFSKRTVNVAKGQPLCARQVVQLVGVEPVVRR